MIAGQVRVGEGDAARADRKSGDLVATTRRSRSAGVAWVSRGAHKLVAALDAFGWTRRVGRRRRRGLDGRFTDVLLRAGATRVYAVDVGYGQLAERFAMTRASSRWSASTPGP